METCRECNRPLQWAHEIENGNLCAWCGPGSLKWQEKQKELALAGKAKPISNEAMALSGNPQLAQTVLDRLAALERKQLFLETDDSHAGPPTPSDRPAPTIEVDDKIVAPIDGNHSPESIAKE